MHLGQVGIPTLVAEFARGDTVGYGSIIETLTVIAARESSAIGEIVQVRLDSQREFSCSPQLPVRCGLLAGGRMGTVVSFLHLMLYLLA